MVRKKIWNRLLFLILVVFYTVLMIQTYDVQKLRERSFQHSKVIMYNNEGVHALASAHFRLQDELASDRACMTEGIVDNANMINHVMVELRSRFDYIEKNTTMILPEIIKQSLSSIVHISVPINDDFSSHGTGFVINEELGYILTVKHIFGDLDTKDILIMFSNGVSVKAKSVFLDPNEDLAIVVLGVGDPNYIVTTQLKLSDSKVQVGQLVVAIGHPFDLKNTVTMGIVSNPKAYDPPDVDIPSPEPWIQFDCAVNPGNSGGPLINLNGEVIGIVESCFCFCGPYIPPQNAGVNGAIPIKNIRESLIRFNAWLEEND